VAKTEKATFALGCFWQPQMVFDKVEGVVKTRVGYAGGSKERPTYEDLGDHTETIEIEFDPARVGYAKLLNIFWMQHNPTVEQKTQYQSKIFYHDETQKALAEKTKAEQGKKYRGEILTEILPAGKFWEAEEYHQKYLVKCGLA
jgi:peptide-methionine (S)-S-oxide reductase